MAEDAQLADAIRRLRGEWAEAGGGELVVEAISSKDLLAAHLLEREEPPPAFDLLIFPSRYLGELCETGRLRPMRTSVLNDSHLRVEDFFPQVRERLIVFGGETMALPVGCAAPVIVYNAEGEALDTWEEMLSRFDFFGDWTGGGGERFLACAGSYARHTSREALLFDPETMKSRLVDPPFVHALNEIVALAARPGVRKRHRERQAVILRPYRIYHDLKGEWSTCRVAPLPGAEKVYNPVAGQWEAVDGEPRRVPLLAAGDQLVGVTTSTRNAAPAFRLAAWLTSPQNARQLSTVGFGYANVRKSLSNVPDDWTGMGNRDLGKKISAAQEASLSSREAFLIPRIIRIDDYLAALDAEVDRAIAGEATPKEALQAASDAWEELTEEIGRDRQRRCYERHLRRLGE